MINHINNILIIYSYIHFKLYKIANYNCYCSDRASFLKFLVYFFSYFFGLFTFLLYFILLSDYSSHRSIIFYFFIEENGYLSISLNCSAQYFKCDLISIKYCYIF